VPELVSFPHREKAKEKSNACNEHPKESRKGSDLSQREKKSDKTTE